MRLVFARTAKTDLRQIADYIAEQSPDRAESFIEELREKSAKIVYQPYAYPPRDDLAPDLREAIHKSYLILFRTTDTQVEIVRIVHGARDLKNLSYR